MSCDHKFVDSTACLKCGWQPSAPRQVGSRPVELDLKGLLLPWRDEAAVVLRVLGGGVALPLFTTTEKLATALGEFDIPFTSIKVIDDAEVMLASVPADMEIIVDPWKTPEGKVRYFQAMGRLKPA